ncbi:MAG: YaeQ family protein [Burkholderiaceae bacterium]|nr:YaeQ family protein [Burkholderiaceae bacterium]
MALKSIIYKALLQVADMDRHYYADHTLNIACHPSETLERMMVRVLAFGLNAHERLEFGKGISDTDEPDLWRKDLTGAIEQWIEVGQPDERRVLKACGRAQQVMVYAYGSNAAIWWKQSAGKLARARNLTVLQIAADIPERLATLCERTMQLQLTVQDGEVWMRSEAGEVQVMVAQIA